MPYATLQNMEDIYGVAEVLLVADRNNDGLIDVNSDSTTVVDAALSGASDEIDTYLSNRYSLPLPTVPQPIVDKCVDLAMYRLAGAVPGQITDDRRARYKDAIAWLQAVAAGRVDLGIPQDTESKAGGPDVTFQPRVFSRSNKVI